jgi:hypothetical protein
MFKGMNGKTSNYAAVLKCILELCTLELKGHDMHITRSKLHLSITALQLFEIRSYRWFGIQSELINSTCIEDIGLIPLV